MRTPAWINGRWDWHAWAFRFKVDPEAAGRPDAGQAWQAARAAVLDAVPVALAHAGLPSLDAYARRDGLLDHLVYYARAWRLPRAHHLAVNPTGRVRVATLRLLERSPDGTVRSEAAEACLGPPARAVPDPLRLLDALRRATLQ